MTLPQHADLCLLEQVKLANRIKDSFLAVPQQHTRGLLTARLQTLESNFLKFQQQHVELLKAIGIDKEQVYFKDDLASQTEEWYQAAKGQYLDALDALPNPHAHDSSFNVTSRVVSTPNKSFPKITLPTFSGNYTEWSNFADLFTSLIHENPDLTNVMKLHYLKTNVSGEPAQLLRNIQITNDNYQRAWTLLVNRYQNKRMLINCHLSVLFALKPLTKETASGLKQLVNTMVESLEALNALGCLTDSWSPFLVFFVTNCLDPQTRREWETSLGDSTNPPPYSSLRTFLNNRVRTLEILEGNSKQTRNYHVSTKGSAASSHVITDQQDQPLRKCYNCGQQHFLMYCQKFRAMTAAQRREFAAKNKLCLNCLRPHSINECSSSRTCRLCDQKHHTLLHLDSQTVNFIQQTSTDEEANHQHAHTSRQLSHDNHYVEHHHTRPRAKGLLPTAILRVKGCKGSSILVRALLDQGSEVSLISEALAQRLRLSRANCEVGLLSVGTNRPTSTNGLVSCVLAPHFDSDFECSIDALVLPRLSSYVPRFENGNSNWSHLSGLRLADPDFGSGTPLDVIIGADFVPYLLLPNIRKGSSNSPVAQETHFGWILSGRTLGDASVDPETNSSTAASMHVSVMQDVTFDLQRFWDEQEIPSKTTLTSEEQECEDFFTSTHSRNSEGRYVVRLPMKKKVEHFGNSYRPALRMLHHMERRFKRDPALSEAYTKFLEEYRDLGHMELIDESSILQDSSRSFFLPHHGIWRETSSTTKLRVVFNGSQRTDTGVSINECLHIGPTILPNLMDVLLRWRFHRIAVCADVEKMYRQIQVHRDDQDLQLILWRKSAEDPIQMYRLKTVTYGMSSSPFLALRCIQQLAIDEGHHFHLASKAIHQGTYVDDIITGADDVNEAVSLQDQLQRLFMAGGFPLRKWTSNNSELLDTIPLDIRASSQPLQLHPQQSFHMLGVTWVPERDVFTFKFKLPTTSDVITKRSILSETAQLFDPLGWLSPIIVTAKILIQSLWLLKNSWDDELPLEIQNTWLNYRDSLQEIDHIEVPRWIQFRSSSGTYELHGFCDASERAYAASIYLSSISASGESSVCLITSKTKVAPLKQVSLPRLELCGAVLLVRLMDHVQRTTMLNVPIHLWSDSSVTLAWIQGHPTKWKTYIANRVSEIQTTLPSAIWHYVPSKSNPADCASRGIPAGDLGSFSLWWHGPNWLSSHSCWPEFPSSRDQKADMEERTLKVHTTSAVPSLWVLLHRYSTFIKLLRATAWLLRFIRNRRQPSESKSATLIPTELHTACMGWIRHEQNYYFQDEIKALESGVSLLPKSRLCPLTPFLDSTGLLRVGGRLKHSLLSPDEKHPIILPSESRLTTLIIAHEHQRCLHGGVQLTLSTLRQKYWILRGRIIVRSFIHKCLPCLRHRAVKSQQLMANLPAIRATPALAFLHTGVDYAGPINLRTARGRGYKSYKGYIAVFICCSTRAVHLEAVSDYTAEGFLAAFRRFTSRRGICATLSSDRGTNFVGADAQLKSLFSEASKELTTIACSIASDGTEWRFNPPGAPHFGGLWEAAVKAAKHHLKRVIGDTTLTFEEMTTFLAQVEACLNSRPLHALTDDPDDLRTLTPGHFLIGRPLNQVPEPTLLNTSSTRLSRWQFCQQMREHFWHRWTADYLKELQPRSKWRTPYPSLEIGDLVLIRDENLPPTKWALGRVITLHPGSDNLVRVVSLKTKGGVLKRPIVKLCLLPRTSNIN